MTKKENNNWKKNGSTIEHGFIIGGAGALDTKYLSPYPSPVTKISDGFVDNLKDDAYAH